MAEKKELIIRIIDGCCVGQFVIVFLYIQVFLQPVTRTHMIFVGVSAALGLLLSALARQMMDLLLDKVDYQGVSEETRKMLQDIDQADKEQKK